MKSTEAQAVAQLGRKLHNRARSAAGFTLIETVAAVAILVIALVGVAALFGSTYKMNFWQGDASTRTVEYAQDKMESLLALSFADNGTDTTTKVWPYCNPSVYLPGTTTPACVPTANATGLNVGGSADPENKAANYYDYLTAAGDIQTDETNAAYIRVWSITQNGDTSDPTVGVAYANTKTITVVVKSLNKTILPVVTKLVCVKTAYN